MIEHKTRDIFDEDVEALVNSVNCVGVMGRGIALQCKRRFPGNFKAYAAACEAGEVRPGRMFVHELGHVTNPRYIINFPTKRHWRGKSRMDDIEAGLQSLVGEIRDRNIRSIAIPPLGASLGGLDWAEVRPRIEAALTGLSQLDITLFEPGGGPTDNRPNRSTGAPKMTPGRAALICLMDQYIRGLLDPFVTPLEVHKLMYFLEKDGEPLRLRFEKGRYGPYSDELRHVMRPLEGHFLSGYSDDGDAPGKALELLPGAVEDAAAFLEGRPDTQRRLERVSELVRGFESAYGLELLATAHWVASGHPSGDDTEVIAYTHAWNPRKGQFTVSQIELALETLRDRGWLQVPAAQPKRRCAVPDGSPQPDQMQLLDAGPAPEP